MQAGTAQSVEHLALVHEVVGLNMPAIVVVTLGGHSRGSLTTPTCKIWTRPRPVNSELTLRIITHKQEQSVGNDGSTLV